MIYSAFFALNMSVYGKFIYTAFWAWNIFRLLPKVSSSSHSITEKM